jgi:hypothetical protein
MKAVSSPETSVNFYHPTQQNIPDNTTLHTLTAAINYWNQIILVLKCPCPMINCMETKEKAHSLEQYPSCTKPFHSDVLHNCFVRTREHLWKETGEEN